MRAVRDLAACEGIFAEPSGAAAVAGLRGLLQEGIVRKNDTVVVLITGSGLKEPDKVMNTVSKSEMKHANSALA